MIGAFGKSNDFQISSPSLLQTQIVYLLDKRFGIIALEKGFVTADQIVGALKTQVEEDMSSGTHRLIGRILLEKQVITLSQLDEILGSMEKAPENV